MIARHVVAVTAALLATAAAPAGAQSLGRLFTSAEQRANLDELRDQAHFERPEREPEQAPQPTGGQAAAAEPAGQVIERLTINGVVRAARGPGAVWVNGDLIERGGVTREGLRVDLAGRRPQVKVRLPSGVDSVALKPGQRIEVSTGAVREAYERAPRDEGPAAFPAAPRVPGPEAGAAPAALDAQGLEAAARAGVVPAPTGTQ